MYLFTYYILRDQRHQGELIQIYCINYSGGTKSQLLHDLTQKIRIKDLIQIHE